MSNIVTRFLDWYNSHLTESLAISAVILYLQIPHTISAAECFFDGNLGLFGIHANCDEIAPFFGSIGETKPKCHD